MSLGSQDILSISTVSSRGSWTPLRPSLAILAWPAAVDQQHSVLQVLCKCFKSLFDAVHPARRWHDHRSLLWRGAYLRFFGLKVPYGCLDNQAQSKRKVRQKLPHLGQQEVVGLRPIGLDPYLPGRLKLFDRWILFNINVKTFATRSDRLLVDNTNLTSRHADNSAALQDLQNVGRA